jgi:hypothetical protein
MLTQTERREHGHEREHCGRVRQVEKEGGRKVGACRLVLRDFFHPQWLAPVITQVVPAGSDVRVGRAEEGGRDDEDAVQEKMAAISGESARSGRVGTGSLLNHNNSGPTAHADSGWKIAVLIIHDPHQVGSEPSHSG